MKNQVVAYTPGELVIAQRTVRSWCAENIRRLYRQKQDADKNVQTAISGKFNSKPFKTLANRCERRIVYYKKIGKAIKLGYMIVPNFDMDLFAVRTGQRKPRKQLSTWNANFEQEGQQMPEGEGRYVDVLPFWSEKQRKRKRDDEMETVYFPTAFDDEISFPVAIVHPEIIHQTKRALGHKLFDQIGVARGTRLMRADPIVCGRFLDPVKRDKAVTFFIAWWMDQDDI
jgi:hypothetical protein